MKKKIAIAGVVASLMMASAGVGAYAATKMTLIVNGSVANVDPKVINGTTYVPVRAAAELLGPNVNYDSKSNTVTITSKGSTAPKNVMSADGFVFTQLQVEEGSFGWEIDVEVTNKNDKAYSATFTASFYDEGGKRIGSALGTVSDLAKNGTKTTSMLTTDDLTGWKTVKFQIDIKV